MTAIAYRDGVLAADTAGWYGDIVYWHFSKIFRFSDGTLFAAMGQAEYWDAFVKGRIKNEEPTEIPEKDEDFYGILILPCGKVQFLGRSFKPHDAGVAPFYAIGAHVEFLTGAMAAGASAEEAVRLCIEYCAHAAGEVRIERLEPALMTG